LHAGQFAALEVQIRSLHVNNSFEVFIQTTLSAGGEMFADRLFRQVFISVELGASGPSRLLNLQRGILTHNLF